MPQRAVLILILSGFLAAHLPGEPALAESEHGAGGEPARQISERAPISPEARRAAERIARGRDAGFSPRETATLEDLANAILETRELLALLIARDERGGGRAESSALQAHAARLRTLADEAQAATAGRAARETEIGRARMRVRQLASELDLIAGSKVGRRAERAAALLARLRRDDASSGAAAEPDSPPAILLWPPIGESQ